MNEAWKEQWTEMQGVPITVDRRQVQQLQYVVPFGPPVYDVGKNYFEARFEDGKRTKLADDFVRDTFETAFVKKVMEAGINHSKTFFPLPPGAPRTTDKEMVEGFETFPKLKYQQEDKKTCLFHSFASALHYVGLQDTALVVANNADRFSMDSKDALTSWKGIIGIMERECRWLQPNRISSNNHPILTDISPYPTLVSLQANDGGIEHAVTVVDNWIFDSNCTRALPLTQDNLDHCCSTKESKGKFKRVFHGYRFMENPNVKKPRLAKLTKQFNIE